MNEILKKTLDAKLQEAANRLHQALDRLAQAESEYQLCRLECALESAAYNAIVENLPALQKEFNDVL